MDILDQEQLLMMLGAFIEAADADLVDNRKCFPCNPRDHEHYKAIRDCFKIIYDEADFTQSNEFQASVQGKDDKFIQVKSKIFNDPVKKMTHRAMLLDKLCSLSTLTEAKNYINLQHHELYNRAVVSLAKCSDGYQNEANV